MEKYQILLVVMTVGTAVKTQALKTIIQDNMHAIDGAYALKNAEIQAFSTGPVFSELQHSENIIQQLSAHKPMLKDKHLLLLHYLFSMDNEKNPSVLSGLPELGANELIRQTSLDKVRLARTITTQLPGDYDTIMENYDYNNKLWDMVKLWDMLNKQQQQSVERNKRSSNRLGRSKYRTPLNPGHNLMLPMMIKSKRGVQFKNVPKIVQIFLNDLQNGGQIQNYSPEKLMRIRKVLARYKQLKGDLGEYNNRFG